MARDYIKHSGEKKSFHGKCDSSAAIHFFALGGGNRRSFLSLIKAGFIQWREGHCCRLDCNRQAIGTIYLAFLINFPESFFLIRPENFCSFGKPQEALFVEFTWALMNGPAPIGRGERFSEAIINLSRTQQLQHKKCWLPLAFLGLWSIPYP